MTSSMLIKFILQQYFGTVNAVFLELSQLLFSYKRFSSPWPSLGLPNINLRAGLGNSVDMII